MKYIIVVLIAMLTGAFSAQACPTTQNDWISGQWECVGQNKVTMDISLRLITTDKAAFLEVQGDSLPEQIKLDGKSNLVSDEGIADSESKVSYVATCNDSAKSLDIDFDIVYKTATEAHVAETYSSLGGQHLQIQYEFKDGSQPANSFVCVKN